MDYAYAGLPDLQETGEFNTPFNTLGEAVSFARTGSNIRVRAGVGHETLTINKALRIESYGGPVTIGP